MYMMLYSEPKLNLIHLVLCCRCDIRAGNRRGAVSIQIRHAEPQSKRDSETF